MTNQVIPAQAVEAAMIAFANAPLDPPTSLAQINLNNQAQMTLALEAAAPHLRADILEDAASTAETDELTTAAEVIYDLRRHAKDLRPTNAR